MHGYVENAAFYSSRPSDAYKLNIIGSDNGLSPERRQAIMWTNAGILIGPSGANFGEILIRSYIVLRKRWRDMHI